MKILTRIQVLLLLNWKSSSSTTY